MRGIPAAVGAFLVIGAAQALYGPLLPVLRRDLAAPDGVLGFLLAAHWSGALVAVAMIAIVGRARQAERFRPACAALVLGVGAIGLGWLPSWPVALMSAVAVGLGYGALAVDVNAIAGAGAHRGARVRVNLVNAAFGLGAVLAPLVMAVADVSPRAGFLVVGAASIALTPVLLVLDPRGSHPQTWSSADAPEGSRRTTRPVPDRSRTVSRGALLVIALGTATEASVAGWGPIGLVASGLSEGRAALALSQYFAVFLLFRLLGVPLAARFPARHLVVVALTLSAIGAGLTLLLDQPEHAFALTGAIGLAFPNAFVWATGGTTGTARPAAVVVGTALVGAVLGPLAVGRLSGLAGGDALAALALLSVCAAAASVLVFGLTKREERGATATVASGAADRR